MTTKTGRQEVVRWQPARDSKSKASSSQQELAGGSESPLPTSSPSLAIKRARESPCLPSMTWMSSSNLMNNKKTLFLFYQVLTFCLSAILIRFLLSSRDAKPLENRGNGPNLRQNQIPRQALDRGVVTDKPIMTNPQSSPLWENMHYKKRHIHDILARTIFFVMLMTLL